MLHVHYIDEDKANGPIITLLKEFCDSSKGNNEWRRLIKAKGIVVNDKEIKDEGQVISEMMINNIAVVRIGKKKFCTLIKK